jgi:hypothetical protein
MAGATKTEFDGAWDRTTTRPLDDVYGAGELNIQRSHHIMMAGEQNASSSSTVPSMGWDFGVTAASDALYFFDVLPNTQITELSALLTWNRIVSPGSSWLSMDTTLANLDLRLYQANNFTLGNLLDQSLSTVDNVEHIYLDDILNPGRYALEVSSNMLNYEYGLAWHSTTIAVPEPSGVALVAIAAGALMRRRRR